MAISGFSISELNWRNNRLKTVSVRAVASSRAVLRCCSESFMLSNNMSREKGS